MLSVLLVISSTELSAGTAFAGQSGHDWVDGFVSTSAKTVGVAKTNDAPVMRVAMVRINFFIFTLHVKVIRDHTVFSLSYHSKIRYNVAKGDFYG